MLDALANRAKEPARFVPLKISAMHVNNALTKTAKNKAQQCWALFHS